jgi:hypothetical protein
MGIEAQEADMASSGKGVDVRGEVVNLFLEKIASDRNPSVTMMNMVEELLTPDDVPAYVGVLMDKVKTGRQVPELLPAPPDTGPYFIARAGLRAGPRLALPLKFLVARFGWAHRAPQLLGSFAANSAALILLRRKGLGVMRCLPGG